VSSENWLTFWKEHFLKIKDFKVEIGSVCSKSAWFAKVRKQMNLSKENHGCSKQKRQAYCFPVRIELVLERNTMWLWKFSGWRKGHWVPNHLFRWFGETPVHLQRRPSLKEAVASVTLYSRENWVIFCNEYFLQILHFKVQKGSFYSKTAYTPQLWKRMYASKGNHLC
jgi:hypothetical protein